MCSCFGSSIRPFEKGFGETEAGFGFRGQKEVGYVFRLLGFRVGVAGEEGGVATVDRSPPSSPAGASHDEDGKEKRELQSNSEFK